MKYTTEIVIDLPRPRLIELLADPGQMTAWQPGLENVGLPEGQPGQPGAIIAKKSA